MLKANRRIACHKRNSFIQKGYFGYDNNIVIKKKIIKAGTVWKSLKVSIVSRDIRTCIQNLPVDLIHWLPNVHFPKTSKRT